MKHISTTIKALRQKTSGKVLLGGLFVLAIGGFLGYTTLISHADPANASSARDCDSNAIVKCGVSSANDVISKVKGSNELQHIYSGYGLQSSDYSRFQKTAKLGYVTKSGNVVVGGKTVGTGSDTIGRQYISGSSKKTINGKTYYSRKTSVSFVSNSIPAYVMMNGDQVEFVVLTACGNPVHTHPKGSKPIAKCDLLQVAQTAGTLDTFEFTTKATASNGAKITKVTYTFGDNTASVTKNTPTEKVTHKYAKPGNYTAKVTVYFTANAGCSDTSDTCEHPITVKPPVTPVYACLGLGTTLANDSNTKYTFTANAKAENGAVLQSGSFNFGDGATANGTVSGNNVTATHDYTKSGTFTTTATLTFNVGSTTKTATCSFTVKPEIPQPAYQCTGLAVTKKDRTDFEFKGSGTATNATITGYRYTVKNSTGTVLLTKDTGTNEVLPYSQTTTGDYTVSVQVIVSVNGTTAVTPVSETCTKPFTVTPPPVTPVAECTALTATLKTGSDDTYDFATSTHTEGNAQPVSYSYNFGDTQTQVTGNTTSHQYTTAGDYTAKVTVTFNVDGQQQQKTSEACTVPVKVKQQECKPGIPTGSPQCNECKPGVPAGSSECTPTCENGGKTGSECTPTCENGGIPSTSPQCTPTCENGGVDHNSAQCSPTCENGGMTGAQCQPKALPATGAETAVGGLFGSSALAGAGYYWRNSRKNLASKLLKRKK